MTTITALVRLSPSQGNRIFHSTEDESEVLFIKKKYSRTQSWQYRAGVASKACRGGGLIY